VMGLLKNIALGVAGVYVCDVTIRESLASSEARRISRRLGKPMLNVGSGSGFSSATGPKLRGDVNCDLAAQRSEPCGPKSVCFCDAADLSRFKDKQFGVALAANVLKYVPDKARAISELQRVADVVVISDNLLPWPQIGAGSMFALHGDLT